MSAKKSPSKSKTTSDQLAELGSKLATIRKQKDDLKAGSAYNIVKGDASSYGDYSQRPKKLFNHPKLEHVYGQIVFSPYNFSPMEKYPREIHKIPAELADLRAREVQANCLPKGAPPPNLDLPFDLKKVKNEFIKIVNYKSKFGKEYANMSYESDYGVKATSRVIKPGSTLAQIEAAANERHAKREKYLKQRKMFKTSKSLQFLCSTQSGGPAKFREKLKKVREIASPEKRSRGSSRPAPGTASSDSALMLQLDTVEKDILKNIEALEAKREYIRSTSKEGPRVLKKQPSTPQLYRRLTRLPSSRDNVLPPIPKEKSEDEGTSSPQEVETAVVTQLPTPAEVPTQLATPNGQNATESSFFTTDEVYEDEFAPDIPTAVPVPAPVPKSDTKSPTKENETVNSTYEDDFAAETTSPEKNTESRNGDYAEDFAEDDAAAEVETAQKNGNEYDVDFEDESVGRGDAGGFGVAVEESVADESMASPNNNSAVSTADKNDSLAEGSTASALYGDDFE